MENNNFSGTPLNKENNLARIYMNTQKLNKIYSPLEGLMQGTIFPELVMPYKSWRTKNDRK